MGSNFLVMISSVDCFYLMDTEPDLITIPACCIRFLYTEPCAGWGCLCRIQCGICCGLGYDSVHRSCCRWRWCAITAHANVLGTAKCLCNLHSRALFGNLTLQLQLMSNNGCICGNECRDQRGIYISQLQTLFKCLGGDAGLHVQLMDGYSSQTGI